MAWIVYFCYEIGLIVNGFSQHPLCPYDPANYGSFYGFACAVALSGFFFTLIMLVAKVIQTRSEKERISNFIAINIVLIGLVSTFLAIFFNVGGICVDSLG